MGRLYSASLHRPERGVLPCFSFYQQLHVYILVFSFQYQIVDSSLEFPSLMGARSIKPSP
jgi:hypothetical protein